MADPLRPTAGPLLRVLIVEDSTDDSALLVHELQGRYDTAYERARLDHQRQPPPHSTMVGGGR